MDHKEPHHHKHHHEEHHQQTGDTRRLPFHPGWLYGLGMLLTILVVLVWTLLY